MRSLLTAAACVALWASGCDQPPPPPRLGAPQAASRPTAGPPAPLAPRPAARPAGIAPTQAAPTRAEDWLKLVPAEGLCEDEYARVARQTLKKLLAMKLRWSEVPVWADPTGTIHYMMERYAGPPEMINAGLYPDGGLRWLRSPYGRFRMQWYPSGRPMAVESYGSERLVSGRYYGPDGKVLAKVDDGTGTRLVMSVDPARPGDVTARVELLNGLVHGIRTTYSRDAEPGHKETRFRQGLPISTDPRPRAEMPVDYCNPHLPYHWYPNPSRYIRGDGDPFSPEDVKAAAQKHRDMPPTIAAAIVKHPHLEAPYRKLAAEKGFTPVGIVVSRCGMALVWGTFRTQTPRKGIPNAVHLSRDGGRTWARLTVPADYVLRVGFGTSGTICAEASLLPPEGLGNVPHGTFLRSFTFASADGKTWIRGTRYRCEPIAKQQRLPGGRGKIVWVRPFAYKAPTVTYIYLVRGLAEPPILLGSDAYYSRASVTWSKDGKTITVKSNSPDRSFVLDVEKGERTPLPADANTPSP